MLNLANANLAALFGAGNEETLQDRPFRTHCPRAGNDSANTGAHIHQVHPHLTSASARATSEGRVLEY